MEADGLVWVWPGGSEALAASPAPPPLARPPPGYQVHAELVLEVPVEHGLLLENLLDLAHAPFTHTSTFAKGWPVPGALAVGGWGCRWLDVAELLVWPQECSCGGLGVSLAGRS